MSKLKIMIKWSKNGQKYQKRTKIVKKEQKQKCSNISKKCKNVKHGKNKQVLHRDNWVGGARFPCAVVNIMYMQFRLQVK